MNVNSFAYIDIICVIASSLIGAAHHKSVDINGRVVIAFLLFSCLTEIVTQTIFLLHGNKAPVFHFSAIVNFLIVTIYFIKTITVAKESLFILLALVILPLTSILNTVYLQPINNPNTNILVLRSFCIIAMALIALYKMLIDDTIARVTLYPHFYFWGFLLMMHTGTFFFWGLLLIIAKENKQYLPLIQYIQGSINALVYLGMGLTFLLYRKRALYERQ